MSLIRRARGDAFCRLFNIAALLKGIDYRIHRDKSTKQLVAECSGFSLRFFHEEQAYLACKRGSANRIRRLRDVYFLDDIPFEEGDLVVDCGANIGEIKYAIASTGVAINCIGVEPSPLEFKCLRENVAPSQAWNLGLWHEDGELDFFVSSQGVDSSLIKPNEFDEVVKIPTKRLDTLISGQSIKLLKLQAEGAEPEVIRGCENLLPSVAYISADLGFERGTSNESTLAPVTNYLLQRGFDLVKVRQGRVTALFRNRNLPAASSGIDPQN